jgi:enoyl-[acyl-carrier protein] reductase/trans-2-enoyl-CoA reductase (NAD+)
MNIQPKVRGFICTTAHPQGCAAQVQQQIDYVSSQSADWDLAVTKRPQNVLVIGSSTGYGLASRIVPTFAAGAKTIGVCFEKPAQGKRTASAGWYNTAAFEQAASAQGHYAKTLNGDAFSDQIKQQTIDLIKQDWGTGSVDLVIYSLASPRRLHPRTGVNHQSVLKPVGKPFHSKTIDAMAGVVQEISLEPATQEEIDHTVAVMGGEDWRYWLEALMAAKVLAPNVVTLAYSYIGPQLTYPIYRQGTIGRAKSDLEQTATLLDKKLAPLQGKAYVSINKALVTQASSAIPVVPLYLSLLYRVMKDKQCHEGCIEQIQRLFSQRLYTSDPITTDEQGRIRIDDWEMRTDIQAEVEELFTQVNTENLADISDLAGYQQDFYRLFGFSVAGIDYSKDSVTEVAIPSLV